MTTVLIFCIKSGTWCRGMSDSLSVKKVQRNVPSRFSVRDAKMHVM